MDNPWPISTRERVTSLILGCGYLLLLTLGVRALYEIPFAFAALSVVVGAIVIITTIAIFCIKLVKRSDESWRVQLSTLFLPFIPLAIFLSLFRRVIELVQKQSRDAWWVEAWPLIPLFAIFVVFTTAVLLMLGEAIVWFALQQYRRKTAAKHPEE